MSDRVYTINGINAQDNRSSCSLIPFSACFLFFYTLPGNAL